MEGTPGDIQLRWFYRWRTHGGDGPDGRSQEIGSLEDPVQRHVPADYSKMRAGLGAVNPARPSLLPGNLKINSSPAKAALNTATNGTTEAVA